MLTDSGIIVDDWLWTDERSHINILVHLKNENKYLLFKQKKYGLEREYYALIGGLFNEGETGLEVLNYFSYVYVYVLYVVFIYVCINE